METMRGVVADWAGACIPSNFSLWENCPQKIYTVWGWKSSILGNLSAKL